MNVNSGTKVGEREICLLNNIKKISVIKPQTNRVVPTVVAVWSDSRLLSQLLHGDPAEKPCLRPFLPSSSPLICLSVCLDSSCSVLISRSCLFVCPFVWPLLACSPYLSQPLCRPHRAWRRASHKSDLGPHGILGTTQIARVEDKIRKAHKIKRQRRNKCS